MKTVAAAIVTASFILADVASDIAVKDPGVRSSWNIWATIALVLFVVYLMSHENNRR